MEKGIMICGLNGSGKSTLGSALAESLGYFFIDNEDLFFPKTDPNYLFASPRSREEAIRLLAEAVQAHPNFVFSAVRGDYGEVVPKLYRCVIRVEVPKEIRLQRVQRRSYEKFGARMLPGGDLHVQESAFFAMAAGRTEQYVAQWVATLHCPVLRVDGTRPVAENVAFIRQELRV